MAALPSRECRAAAMAEGMIEVVVACMRGCAGALNVQVRCTTLAAHTAHTTLAAHTAHVLDTTLAAYTAHVPSTSVIRVGATSVCYKFTACCYICQL